MKWIDWMKVFHRLVISFLGGFALTLTSPVADQKLLSFNESNDIAFDMVLIGVGALGAFYIKGGSVEATIDAGVGDVFLRPPFCIFAIHAKRLGLANPGALPEIGTLRGIAQPGLGAGAILRTVNAF